MSPPRLVVGERPLAEVLRWAQGVLGAPPSGVAAARGAASVHRAAAAHAAAGALAPGPVEPALELLVPDPDAGRTCWPGERRPDGAPQRSWRAWVDLAAGLGCALGTPTPVGDGTVRVALWPLDHEAPWHGAPA
ncbi:MAG: hypothetical protein P1P87_06955, partial [Trueperaceae bacterium]|nr:hypothetical protein [Trueperaceae bacterium]